MNTHRSVPLLAALLGFVAGSRVLAEEASSETGRKATANAPLAIATKPPEPTIKAVRGEEFPRAFTREVTDPGDWAQLEPLFVALKQQIQSLKTPEELREWLLRQSELYAMIEEEGGRRYIAFSTHTDDPAAEAANRHFVEVVTAKFKPWTSLLGDLYLGNSARHHLDPQRMEVHDRMLENLRRLFRPENVPLQSRDDGLMIAYDKICGEMTVRWQGEERTVDQMAALQEEPDRAVREAAWRTVTARRMKDRERINTLFDDMVRVRDETARNAGIQSYRDFRHLELNRFDYSPQDAEAFDDAILREVVPVASRILRKRREALKLDRLRPWDLEVDLSGRPPLKPFADVDRLISGCAEIFAQIDPEFGAQFEVMRTGGLLDLANRPGKAAGGYQWGLDEVRLPFIFMNATGTQGDVMTLLHEGGHSFHAFAVRSDPLFMYRETFTPGLPASIPLEFAEVASQSMAMFGVSRLDVFYANPKDCQRAQRVNFEGIILFLPWMAAVDSFQHWVYTHPVATPHQREEEWARIYTRFHPEVDWTGLEPELGASFHKKLHFFTSPLYYIEYGIAYIGALQLWQQYTQNPANALENYRRALSLGGSRPLPELFEAAGTKFDLSAPMLRKLMTSLEAELKQLQ